MSGGCKCRSPLTPPPPLAIANSAPPNPLAGFEGTLRGREKRGNKERKETEGVGEKHPQINFCLRP